MNRMVFSDGGETAMCYIEKKLSAPESGSQKEGASFCILFSATNTVIARKALGAGKWRSRSSRLRGLQIFNSGGQSCKNQKEPTFPGCVPCLTLHSRDSLSLPVSCHIAAEDMAAAANCSPTTPRGPERKPGKAGWTGIYPGANLGQVRFHAKWGSKTYPNADNFEIFRKSTKFNSNERNVFVNERPKKCSWQSSLKVLEEHLKGAKSVSNKSPAFTSRTGDGGRHFWEPPWIFPTGNTHRYECLNLLSSKA